MKINRHPGILAAIALICAAAVPTSGQNNAPKRSTPAPAARGVSDAEPDTVSTPQVEPDTHTLSGTERFSVGSVGRVRNVFDPSFSVTALGDSIGAGSSGASQLYSAEILAGQFNFNRIWSTSRFTAAYNGGTTLYQGTQQNTYFHNAILAEEIQWQRWRLNLRDDFLASPSAAFGGAGMGGPGLIGQFSSQMGGSLGNIAETVVPSETIQTGQATRYRNTALGEVAYSFSRRTAVTVSGSYGILHFNQAGYINSRDVSAQVGYDYLLDPKNSIAILGGYGKIDYTGTNISTQDYMAAFAYGRKITGHLAFQASVGPEQIRSTGAPSFQIWTWTANSALTYQQRRTQYSAAFVRGLVSGSGVFFGANSDTFSGSVTHQFTRYWTGAINGGYAYNRTIAPAGVSTISYTNWYFGTNASRRLGHHAHVTFNYGILKQDSIAACPVLSCGSSGFQQTFGATVDWHLRPIE